MTAHRKMDGLDKFPRDAAIIAVVWGSLWALIAIATPVVPMWVGLAIAVASYVMGAAWWLAWLHHSRTFNKEGQQ